MIKLLGSDLLTPINIFFHNRKGLKAHFKQKPCVNRYFCKNLITCWIA